MSCEKSNAFKLNFIKLQCDLAHHVHPGRTARAGHLKLILLGCTALIFRVPFSPSTFEKLDEKKLFLSQKLWCLMPSEIAILMGGGSFQISKVNYNVMCLCVCKMMLDNIKRKREKSFS